MAGFAMRYNGSWYYRRQNGTWLAVVAELVPDTDPRARDLTPATTAERIILEDLFVSINDPKFPARLKPGLLLAIPASRQLIEDAIARRPSRQP